jgi:hypothetical protein
MTVKSLLADAMKYCNLQKIEVLKVSPLADNKLRFQSFDSDRVLFIDGYSVDGYEEIKTEFGLFNFKILKGLLSHSSYQNESAVFKIGTREIDGQSVPDRLEFKGGGSKATFRLMNKEVIPEQPVIVNIPWDVSLVLTDGKFTEFNQMASLYSDVEPLFTIRTEVVDGKTKLMVDFGNDSSSTHSATMVLDDEVDGALVGDMRFPIATFITLIKLAGSADSFQLKLTSKGLLGITATTPLAVYNYYIKKIV